jgi:hypothetical protein
LLKPSRTVREGYPGAHAVTGSGRARFTWSLPIARVLTRSFRPAIAMVAVRIF